MQLPFDSISVEDGGEKKNMSPRQFMDLDLPTRVRLVVTGSVKFYSGDVEVPRGEALGALQKHAAK